MKCPGLHCDGCRDGGGGLIALVVVIIAAIAARPVMHAVSDVGRFLAELLHVVLIVAEVAGITAGAIGGITAGAIGVRSIRRGQAQRRAVRAAAGRDLVASILQREQLAPRVWSATVLPEAQQHITASKGDHQ